VRGGKCSRTILRAFARRAQRSHLVLGRTHRSIELGICAKIKPRKFGSNKRCVGSHLKLRQLCRSYWYELIFVQNNSLTSANE
jgi:hypothetical protein